MAETMRSTQARYLGFIFMLALYSASPASGITRGLQECESVCGSSALCETECWYAPDPESEMIPTTCGEFDGGAGNGWCDGNTCVSLCDSNAFCQWGCYYQGEPSSCGEYGQCTLICGDDVCSPGIGENPGTCEDDCGSCGDGQCSVLWGENDINHANYCQVDCGPFEPTDPCEECDPTSQDCAFNEICNSAQCCTAPSNACSQTSFCTSAAQCCSGEVCTIMPGFIGYCTPPVASR